MPPLNVSQIRGLKKPGRYSDGNTLLLDVTPSGRKYWLQRLTVHGKRRDKRLGEYGEDRSDPTLLSLADARVVAGQNRQRAKRGEDPFATASSDEVPTFGEALDRVLVNIKRRVCSPERVRAWLHPLEKYVLPQLSAVRVDRIGRAEVLAVVEPLWDTKYETARQVRRKLRRVLGWAMSHGFVDVNYAGDILDGALCPTEGTSENYRSAPYESVPDVWSTISAASGSPATRLCLKLVLCTAVRSGEARLADWSEIDFAKGEWRIPAARTKTKKPLRQPLSAPAVEVLEQARKLSGGPSPSGYVFPSPVKRGKPLSKATLLHLLDRCSLRALTTVHGLRATFRTWASEQTDADFAVMEMSLGHKVGSNVVQAYARGQLVGKRRFLMALWAAFLTGTLPDWESLIDTSRVVVPFQALRRDGARHWVRIYDPSRREPCDREVTIGQITLAGAEIVSGLDPGDQVLLPIR